MSNQKPNQKPSWLNLIRYILAFIFGRRKAKKEEDRRRFENVVKDIEGGYEEIDKKKEAKRKRSIKKRLKDMF